MVDLLVIGPGKLGMIVARAWKQLNTSASIHLKFRSEQAERSKAMTEEGFHIVPVGEQTVRMLYEYPQLRFVPHI